MRTATYALSLTLVCALAVSGCSDDTLPPIDGLTTDADGGVGDDGGTCGPGTELCGTECVNTDRDNDHCGQCDNPCDPGEVCSGGSCALSCQQGLVKCDGSCVDPLTDLEFCGASSDCQGPNAGEVCDTGQICSGGSCILSCPQGQIDCDNSCIDPLTDLTYCGASSDCQGQNAGETCAQGELCSAGSCAATCQAGLIACGGTCVDPLTSNSFCGASSDCAGENAGETCDPGEVCSAGSCALTCQQGLLDCGGTCIDPQTDRTFCGASADCQGANAGETCDPGELCSAGSCGLSCQQGLVDCNGTCVDPQSDRAFCGASADCQGQNAGETCGPSEVCADGSCELSCPQGQIVCDDSCTDPLTDHDHCGASGDCLGPNAGETCGATEACFNGSCVMVAQTVTLDAIHRGWWSESGLHTASNNNTYTGYHGGSAMFYNSYFIFDLGGLSGTVLAVKIKLEIQAWYSPKSEQTMSVWDVTTAPPIVEANGSGQTEVFDDLGSGHRYGTFTVQQADVGQVLTTALGPQSATDATAALGGLFAVGVASDSAESTSGDDALRFSASDESRTHQLVLTYVP